MSNYHQVSDPHTVFLSKKFDSAVMEIETKRCRVYQMRWWILLISFMISVSSVMHYSQYTIIADVVVAYYGVTYNVVNWSTMVYLLAFTIFGFPATFIPEKWGLRVTVLLAMGLTCLGSWIKVGSIAPDRFWIVLFGQCIIAVGQILLLPLPPKIAAVWFSGKEVSSACSIGLAGIEIGLAVGFLVPPLIFHETGSHEEVTKCLYIMHCSYATVCTAIFCLVIIFFKQSPRSPPSMAQLKLERNKSFCQSVKIFACDRTNMFLTIACGIAIGIYLAVVTLLNQIVLYYYPNSQQDAGWIGVVSVVLGSVGSVVCGMILDKYGKFKQTVLLVSLLGAASMLCYTLAIDKGIQFVYLISATLGFATFGLQVITLELAAELSYPVPEVISAGILTTSTQVFGIAFTYLYSYILDTYGDYYANLSMFVLYLIEFVLMCSLKFDLRRRAINDVTRKYQLT